MQSNPSAVEVDMGDDNGMSLVSTPAWLLQQVSKQ
jgi:hypothetical protein